MVKRIVALLVAGTVVGVVSSAHAWSGTLSWKRGGAEVTVTKCIGQAWPNLPNWVSFASVTDGFMEVRFPGGVAPGNYFIRGSSAYFHAAAIAPDGSAAVSFLGKVKLRGSSVIKAKVSVQNSEWFTYGCVEAVELKAR